MEIRRIKEEDAEALAALESENFSQPWKKEDFIDVLDLDYAVYVAAFAGDELIGCAGVRNLCSDGEITNVSIKKAYRGRGWAKELLACLLEEGEKIGIVNFTLEVRASNVPAISLYKSAGFIEEGKRKNFYENPKEDAIIMWLRKG